MRLLAAKKDISLVDILREAVELYEQTPSGLKGGAGALFGRCRS